MFITVAALINSYRHADFVNCMHVLANLPAFRRKIFSCTLRLILDKIEIIIPYFILSLRYKKEILSKYFSKKKLARSWKLTSKFFRGEYWIKIVFWGGVKTKWIKILSRIFSRRSLKFKTSVINKVTFSYEERDFFQKSRRIQILENDVICDLHKISMGRKWLYISEYILVKHKYIWSW